MITKIKEDLVRTPIQQSFTNPPRQVQLLKSKIQEEVFVRYGRGTLPSEDGSGEIL